MDFFLFVFIFIFILIENPLILEEILNYFSRTYISYSNQINTWWDDTNFFFSKNPKLIISIFIFTILIFLILVVICFF